MNEQTFTDRLRNLAEWLDMNDFPEPREITSNAVRFKWPYSTDPMARLREFVTLFGASEKTTTDYSFILTKKEQIAGFTFSTQTSKSDVCEKREYEETEESDDFTVTRKIIEFRCSKSVLAKAAAK